MDLVVDANVIFASLIKDGVTIELFLKKDFDFYAPEFLFDEIQKHRETILKKTNRCPEELDEIFLLLRDRITIIPLEEFISFYKKAEEISPDPNDAMYFALAMRLNVAIWSNEKKLKEQDSVKVYNTKDLIDIASDGPL